MDANTATGFEYQFFSLPQVLNLVPASRSSLYAWIASGHFPRPYRIGPRRVAWRRDEVESWMSSRDVARQGDEHVLPHLSGLATSTAPAVQSRATKSSLTTNPSG